MTDENKSRIKKLEEEGWIKQFIANEPRLSEAVELYRVAGFEVHLEPLPKGQECETCAGPEEPKECRVCLTDLISVQDHFHAGKEREKEWAGDQKVQGLRSGVNSEQALRF
jgi:hypothetical protein